MTVSVFDYQDYRIYLKAYLKAQPKAGHGIRSHWAASMGCQVAFVSHVLNGLYDLNPEQAEALSRHLAFNKQETEYFLLVVQYAKAGSHHLKALLKEMILERQQKRKQIRERMQIQSTLTEMDQFVYYSSWLYGAIHIILTIPEFQNSPEKIANYFHQDLVLVRQVLEFLETRGLIESKSGKFLVKDNFLFINKESPLYPHQQNFWRHKAIEAIYRKREEEIHFASIFSVAEDDLGKIREILLKSIQQSTDVIKPSKEEKLYAICMDFFEVR